MKASHRSPLQAAGIAAALLAAVIPSVAGAQIGGRQQVPGPDTRRVLVTTFRGEPAPGINIADEIRNRIQSEYNIRTLMPNSKKEIDNTLTSSGYRPDSALSPNDIKELAKLLRTDEIIDGTITKTATGYRVNARFFLPRDVSLAQPLGVFEGASYGDLAKKVVDEYDKARKQIQDNQACENGARANTPQVAIAAARKGLVKYPAGALLKLCLAQTYAGMKLTADSTTTWKDSVIALTSSILAADNGNRIAYSLAYDAYKLKGDFQNSMTTLLSWMEADKGNTTLQDQVIAELVNSGKVDIAVPIIKKLVADNPGDPNYMKTYWQVLRVAKNYKESVPAGMAWAAIDTTAADSNYFDRQIADLVADSSYAKAAEMAAQASAKYPRNVPYLLQKAQNERRAGQLPAAKATLERVVALDPATNGVNFLLGQVAGDMGSIDDVIRYAKADAAVAPANKDRAGGLLLTAGAAKLKAAQASKTIEDYRTALSIFQAADEVSPSAQTAYFIGASAISIVGAMGDNLRTSRSCDDFKAANDLLVLVNINIPKGFSVDKASAGQIMAGAQQYGPFVDSSMKRLCK